MNERIDLPKVYKFREEIGVSEIKKAENYWFYTVFKSVYPTITHRTVYHSTNLLSLNRHRENLILKLEERNKTAHQPSYSTGIEVVPTLTERIIANAEQRIH